MSPLQKKRATFTPTIPELLKDLASLVPNDEEKTTAKANQDQIQKLFPHTYSRPFLTFKKGSSSFAPKTVGVVFSGGQASGGHNVITGLFDALMKMHPESKLYGFLNGPSGICDNKTIELTKEILAPYRNQGGFDLIGSGRTKIETDQQLKDSLNTCNTLALDGLVIIGGDDSNTNGAVLAEYFLENNCKTAVVGVPKTIDGDLRNEYVELSFGFDTATKVYSEMIGNIARDALSAKKYFHFIKLMGRSASHIALECALKTQPNFTLIGEEVLEKKKTLTDITNELVDMITLRYENGKNYGLVLVPEGLIEFIPEVKILIQELNNFLSGKDNPSKEEVKKALSTEALSCFEELPEKIQDQLLLTRDPHGNVTVSQIETEYLLVELVSQRLKGIPFNPIRHFFGYEGRCSMPSNFDTNYCYNLGRLGALLIQHEKTGYMCCLSGLKDSPEFWEGKALPITMLMHIEERHGQPKPVIEKALVDLSSETFTHLVSKRQEWGLEDHYQFPGPIQYFGESEITDSVPLTL